MRQRDVGFADPGVEEDHSKLAADQRARPHALQRYSVFRVLHFSAVGRTTSSSRLSSEICRAAPSPLEQQHWQLPRPLQQH